MIEWRARVFEALIPCIIDEEQSICVPFIETILLFPFTNGGLITGCGALVYAS